MRVLDPLFVGGVQLPNRIAVPAMVTRRSDSDGRVNDVLRSVGSAPYERLTSCTVTRHLDDAAVTGCDSRYIVVQDDAAGRRGRPSNKMIAELDSVAT